MNNFFSKLSKLFLEQGITLIVALVINKLIAVNLDITTIGTAAISITFGSILFSFSLFGIPTMLLKEFQIEKNKLTVNKIITPIISQVIIFILLSFLAYFLIRSYVVFWWIIVFGIFSIFERNSEVVLFSTDRLVQNSIINIIAKIIKLSFLLTVIFTNVFSLETYLLLLVIEIFVRLVLKFVIIYWYVLSYKNFNKFNFRNIIEYPVKSVSLLMLSFNELILEYGDIYLIRHYMSINFVGLYDRGYQIYKKTLLFSQTSGKLNNIYTANDNTSINDLYKKNIFINSFLLLPIILMFVFFSDFFVELLLSKDYLTISTVLSVLLIGTFIDSFSRLNGSIIAYRVGFKYISGITLIGGIVNIVGNIILIPKIGLLGAAVTSSFSHLIMYMLSSRLLVVSNIRMLKSMLISSVPLLLGTFGIIIVLLIQGGIL